MISATLCMELVGPITLVKLEERRQKLARPFGAGVNSVSDLRTQQHYREPLVATNVIVKEAFVSRKLRLVVKVEMGEYFGRDFRKPPKSQLLPQPKLLPLPPVTQ